jgi:hypothetical protein
MKNPPGVRRTAVLFGVIISIWMVVPSRVGADPVELYSSRAYHLSETLRSNFFFFNTAAEGNTDLASPFQVTAPATLASIELKLGLVSGPNELDVWLMGDDHGLPGEIRESMRLSGLLRMLDPFPAEPEVFPVVLARSVRRLELTPGNRYYVGLSLPELGSSASWATLTLCCDQPQVPVFFHFSPEQQWLAGGASHELAFAVFGNLDTAPVPEPATLSLLAAGALMCGARFSRRHRIAHESGRTGNTGAE